MLSGVTVSLPTLATMVVMSVTWAGSIAGVYFGLRNRVAAGEVRMNGLSQRLDAGTVRFSAIEGQYHALEERNRHYGERIVRVETLLGGMDSKLDSIIKQVSAH